MTLLHIDGFDDRAIDLGKWSSSGSTPSYIAGRNGDAWTTTSTSHSATKQVAPADEHATFIAGMAVYLTTAPSSANPFLTFASDSGVTLHVSLYLGTDRVITVRRGSTVIGAASPYTLPTGQWHYVELKATLHDTTGSFELRVDNVMVDSGTGLDTKNAGTKTVFDAAILRGTGVSSLRFDDFYFCNAAGPTNNDFVGDCVVETIYPNGNGNSSQWVGSDSNSTDNYLLVDESGAPSTADYVESDVAGNKDLYDMQSLAHASAAVKGVQVCNYVAKSDAGSRTMRNRVRSSTTEANGAEETLSTSYKVITTILETDPDTTAAWTVAGVNAAQVGSEVVT